MAKKSRWHTGNQVNFDLFLSKFRFFIFICFPTILSDVDFVDTFKAMEKLIDLGLVKSIGVSNFNSQQIDRILNECSVKPVSNQVKVATHFGFLFLLNENIIFETHVLEN